VKIKFECVEKNEPEMVQFEGRGLSSIAVPLACITYPFPNFTFG
jgi:hypothetical protein